MWARAGRIEEVIAFVDDCMVWVVEGCETTLPIEFKHTCAEACNCIESFQKKA